MKKRWIESKAIADADEDDDLGCLYILRSY
jgi:hypothetical protein